MSDSKKPEPRHHFDFHDLCEWVRDHHPDAAWLFEDDNFFKSDNGHLDIIYFRDLIADMRKGEHAGRSVEAIERFRDDLGAGDTVHVHVWW